MYLYGGPIIRVGASSASDRCQSGISGESQSRSCWYGARNHNEMCSKKGASSDISKGTQPLFDFDSRCWWRMGFLVISAFFVVLIGPSRIYLGAHWVTDLLGAYLIEVALLCIALLLYLQLDKRGVLAMHKKLLALIEKIARSKGHRPAQP